MAVREATSERPSEKVMEKSKKADKKVYLITQELKLARVLAGNNKNARETALKTLKKWFAQRSKALPFDDSDLERIWKGLYFSMWMSDKPLVQEECAENISSLIHFETLQESLRFFKAGLTILMNEWFGIDHLRLDKFLMLVRRLLRQMLVSLKKHGLSKKNIDQFNDVISFTILNGDICPPVGLFMHFTEIFLEELAKVTKGNVQSERLVDFLRPFITKLITATDGREIMHIKKFIFIHLIKQSKLGLEYQAKYDAWRQVGFVGTIDNIQKIKIGKDETTSKLNEIKEDKVTKKPLDPRAGRVDVELPLLKFKPKDIVNALQEIKYDKNSNTKTRKAITELVQHFNKMTKGIYPLGTKRVLPAENNSDETDVRKAAKRLIKFDNKLLAKDKGRKKRKINNENSSETVEVLEKHLKAGKRNENNVETVTEEELQRFIKQSEGKLTKKEPENVFESKYDGDNENNKENSGITQSLLKRKRKNEGNSDEKKPKMKRSKQKLQEEIISNIECVFERNSGTWVVYDVSKTDDPSEALSQKSDVISDTTMSPVKNETPTTSSMNTESTETAMVWGKSPSTSGADLGSPSTGKETPSQSKTSPSKSPNAEQGSPKFGLSPVRLFESPQQPNELFPKSAWDEPLQEGEYEICIPSKKHVAKLKRRAKKHNSNVHELIHSSVTQLRGKTKLSLDPDLVKNPFSTPASAKKVKINTKLNQSQEVHEHVQQILSSPGIPYDANKKPSKPLLKTSASSTPVNPFYSKQLSVW